MKVLIFYSHLGVHKFFAYIFLSMLSFFVSVQKAIFKHLPFSQKPSLRFFRIAKIMAPKSLKRLIINTNFSQNKSKPARICKAKAGAEVSKVTEQIEELAEFDSAIQELPEFASIQKQDEPSPLVQDPTEDVNIGSEDDPKILKIGSSLSSDEKERLIHFLKQHQEVFAWTYEDMPGLDPKLVEHRLVLKPDLQANQAETKENGSPSSTAS